MKKRLGKKAGRLPADPEKEADPKRCLLELARLAPREIQEDLLPENGSPTLQGLGYNRRLTECVRNVWNPERAALRSDSLRRARERLRKLAEQLGPQ